MLCLGRHARPQCYAINQRVDRQAQEEPHPTITVFGGERVCVGMIVSVVVLVIVVLMIRLTTFMRCSGVSGSSLLTERLGRQHRWRVG